MKRSVPAILVSMMALVALVNASAEDLPTRNQPSKKTALKDSVKEPTRDLTRLIEVLMKTGDDDRTQLAKLIGLTGTPLTKGRDFTLPRPKGKERRECTIVFSEDSENGVPSGEKQPTCLYIAHKIVSGHDGESVYYRLSLAGKLEHALVTHLKYDDNGKPVPGAAIDVEKDIDSPDVQKAFKAELAYWTKDWLKKEQKILASAKTASASKAAPEGVRASASAESSALEKEATAVGAPTAQ